MGVCMGWHLWFRRNADGIPAALQRARIPQMAADALTNTQVGGAPPDMRAMMANLDLGQG